jgi:hypothetical protein
MRIDRCDSVFLWYKELKTVGIEALNLLIRPYAECETCREKSVIWFE